MVNNWFTSDFHLGHRNIIRYCGRPFASVEQMDAAILANLNKLVGADDVLYFLGDFCLGDRIKPASIAIASSAETYMWSKEITMRHSAT